MNHRTALALLLCGFSAIAQTQKPKNPKPVAPPLAPMAYALEDAFSGLTFSQPVAIVGAPGESERIFVVEKTGCIQVVTQLDQPKPKKHVFANLIERPDGRLDDKGESGVLGLAFHPEFARNGRFFVFYSLRIGGQLHQRISRFQVSPNDPQQADLASEQPLITQADPANNHNGGDLHFGPDGFLYGSVGDGGGANDLFNTGRFINKDFHAAILRIDVDKRPGSLPPNPHPAIARDADGAAYYAVPADNPFIGATSHHGETIDPATVRTEIWATGLRNAWRFCFDSPTGRLFAGDVGQNLYEEVNLITKGGDYGWSHREGVHAFDLGPGKDQQPAEFHPVDPIFEYPRSIGLSITGGRVCRGSKFPEFSGAYLFADYAFGRIIALRERDAKWEHEIIAVEAGIAGIGADPRDGGLLFANLAKGSVMRLTRRSVEAAHPFDLRPQPWQRRDEPILSARTTKESWCKVVCYSPHVIFHEGKFRMWYLGTSTDSRSGDTAMGYAESADGIAWEPHAGNPIFTGKDIGWGNMVQTPFVLFDREEAVFKMWFVSGRHGRNEQGGTAIYEQRLGYATSGDGIRWTVHPEPLYPSGRSPSVIKERPGRYRMWMGSIPDAEEPEFKTRGNIYDAAIYQNIYEFRSSDGIQWKREPQPMMRPSGRVSTVVYPCVLKEGGAWYLWHGGHVAGGQFEIFCATSKDGTTWVANHEQAAFTARLGRTAFDSRYTSIPRVVSAEDRWLLYYSARDWNTDYIDSHGRQRKDNSSPYSHIGVAVIPKPAR